MKADEKICVGIAAGLGGFEFLLPIWGAFHTRWTPYWLTTTFAILTVLVPGLVTLLAMLLPGGRLRTTLWLVLGLYWIGFIIQWMYFMPRWWQIGGGGE